MDMGRSIRVFAYFNFWKSLKIGENDYRPAFSVSDWHRRGTLGQLNFAPDDPPDEKTRFLGAHGARIVEKAVVRPHLIPVGDSVTELNHEK